MRLNIAADHTPQSPHQIVHLSGAGTSDGVGDTNAVYTNLIDGAVDGKKVDQIRSERVFGTEANLLALALDKLDDFYRGILDASIPLAHNLEHFSLRASMPKHRRAAGDVLSHVFSVRMVAEVAGGSNNDIESVNARLDGDSRIVHVAADVSENLGLETELADSFTVPSRLFAGGGRRHLNVVDTKLIQRFRDFDLGLEVEVGIGELLAFAEGAFNDLESAHIGQEVSYRSVGALVVRVGVVCVLDGTIACRAAVCAIGAVRLAVGAIYGLFFDWRTHVCNWEI